MQASDWGRPAPWLGQGVLHISHHFHKCHGASPAVEGGGVPFSSHLIPGTFIILIAHPSPQVKQDKKLNAHYCHAQNILYAKVKLLWERRQLTRSLGLLYREHQKPFIEKSRRQCLKISIKIARMPFLRRPKQFLVSVRHHRYGISAIKWISARQAVCSKYITQLSHTVSKARGLDPSPKVAIIISQAYLSVLIDMLMYFATASRDECEQSAFCSQTAQQTDFALASSCNLSYRDYTLMQR